MAKKRNLYAWRTRTEDGLKREVEAQCTGSKWTIKSRTPEDEDWVTHAKPLLEDLEELESMLFNKYQRKHGSYENVLSVRKLIADRSHH